MTTSVLPLWPGWHRMPPPIAVRWSRDAWEALYPLGCVGWKAWLWEPEPRSYAEIVNQPLSPEAIAALAARFGTGDVPTRKVRVQGSTPGL